MEERNLHIALPVSAVAHFNSIDLSSFIVCFCFMW